MFETSVVRAQGQAARGRIGLLTASLVAHSAAVMGAVALSIATVDFPAVAPDEYARAPEFVPVRIPPPLGNPDGGARPQPAQPQPPRPAPAPTQPTAPAILPETAPVAAAPEGGTAAATAGDGTGGTVVGPVGVPWGVENSIGDLDAPPVAGVPVPAAPEEKIYQPFEVNPPVLIRQVAPRYPPHLTPTRMTATVGVRCVIDKSGNIRDPQIVLPAMAPFNAAVLEVLPQWRYKPATHNGRPVDSYLDLTVTFTVQR